MLNHQTECRVIYGDTDNMGIAYNANYLRWFEMGRNELFRAQGLTYRDLEAKGIFLPVAEAHAKFKTPARYDDILTIETTLDLSILAAFKFDYVIYLNHSDQVAATGFTKHAFMNPDGKVIRPPRWIKSFLQERIEALKES